MLAVDDAVQSDASADTTLRLVDSASEIAPLNDTEATESAADEGTLRVHQLPLDQLEISSSQCPLGLLLGQRVRSLVDVGRDLLGQPVLDQLVQGVGRDVVLLAAPVALVRGVDPAALVPSPRVHRLAARRADHQPGEWVRSTSSSRRFPPGLAPSA